MDRDAHLVALSSALGSAKQMLAECRSSDAGNKVRRYWEWRVRTLETKIADLTETPA